jgi:protein-disulfide isomerase
MSKWISNALAILLSLCALTVTALLVRREFFPPAANPASQPEVVADWSGYHKGQLLQNGSGSSDVALVVFSDYQCPACRRLHATLDSLPEGAEQFPVRYRHLPLSYHPHAQPAAFAAECAAMQGRFQAAHDGLFTDADSIGIRSWGRFAQAVGVTDTVAFSTCVRDSLPIAIIRRDEADAARLGATGTPTVLINNLKVPGAPSGRALQAFVDRARSEAR